MPGGGSGSSSGPAGSVPPPCRRVAGSTRPGASGGSPSQPGGSRSTSVTAVDLRARRRRGAALGPRRPLPAGVVGRRVRRLGAVRGADARAGRGQHAGDEQRDEHAPLDPDVRGLVVDVGLVEQPPHEQRDRPAAGDHDHRAVAAREMERLALRPRPHEVEHAGGHQQDGGLDEREDPERGQVRGLRLAARDERLLVPRQEHRQREPGGRARRLLQLARAARGRLGSIAVTGSPQRSARPWRRAGPARRASDTVRSWPWNASVQCSAGHLRTYSSASLTASAGSQSASGRTSSGSAVKRHG